jgi:hypothetical protein
VELRRVDRNTVVVFVCQERSVGRLILRRYSEQQLKIIWPAGCPSDIHPTGLWGSDDLRKAQEQLKTRRTR